MMLESSAISAWTGWSGKRPSEMQPTVVGRTKIGQQVLTNFPQVSCVVQRAGRICSVFLTALILRQCKGR
jgi:hypothetical protein